MPETLQHYQTILDQVMRRDSVLRKWQRQYERVSRIEQDLPSPLDELEWVVPFKSAAVYNALRGGERALSGLDIRPSLHPLTVQKAAGVDEGDAAEQTVSKWEQILKWNYDRAAARRGNLGPSMIWNALVYDEIVLQLIHLPTQIAILDQLQVNTNRHEAALRYGQFVIKLHDAKGVHVTYSDYMPEQVMGSSVMTASQLVNNFGNGAKEVADKIAGDPEYADTPYVVGDYTDYETHFIWATEGNTESALLDGGFTIMSEENEWPFLNYVAVSGGTITEEKPEFQRKPLVFPVVKAQMWLITNIIGTLMTSQAIAEGNSPTHLFEGVGAENILLDLTEPGGRIDIPNSLVSYEQLSRLQVDPGLREMLDRYESDINRATLPSVLVTAESLPGETFSGYNLRVQTAIGALLPYKRLAEKADWGVFELMLLYSHYSEVDLEGYGSGMKKWEIAHGDINPDAIIGSVELSPDVPIDRLQKITAAVTLATQLNYSPKRVMEFLGETDPQGALEDYIQWQFYLAKMQGKIQKITAEESGELEALARQMAQKMLEDQQVDGAGTGRRALPAPTNGSEFLPPLPEGDEVLRQLDFDTVNGGQPAIEQLGAGATFEGAEGEARGGGAVQTGAV